MRETENKIEKLSRKRKKAEDGWQFIFLPTSNLYI